MNDSTPNDRPIRLAWLPYFPNDFSGTTRGWPLVARAAFHELLDAQWTQGYLPSDPALLRAIVRCSPREWKIAWPFVEQHVPVGDDGQRHNAQLDAHWREQIARHHRRSESGKKGNAIRWPKPLPGDRNATE